jgi:hypothetical protein
VKLITHLFSAASLRTQGSALLLSHTLSKGQFHTFLFTQNQLRRHSLINEELTDEPEDASFFHISTEQPFLMSVPYFLLTLCTSSLLQIFYEM